MSFLKFVRKLIAPAAAAGAAAPTEESGELAGDTMIEVPGVGPVALRDLAADRQNAVQEEADAKAKEEQEAKEKADADAKAKADDKPNAIAGDTRIEVAPGVFATVAELVADRQNAVAKQKEETERQNAVRGAASFRVLAEAKTKTSTESTPLSASAGTLEESVARGRNRYGSAVASGKN